MTPRKWTGYFLAAAVLTLSNTFAETYTWKAESGGVWDDETVVNWDPEAIPTNMDTVALVPTTTDDIEISFASTNFIWSNAVQTVSIGNAGQGRTTLFFGGDSELSYLDDLVIQSGGRLVQTGGLIRCRHGAWNDSLIMNDGSEFILAGGTNYCGAHAYIADEAGENISLVISNGLFRNGVYDLNFRGGNSAVTIAGGTLQSGRAIYIGTLGGTHVWSVVGGTFLPNRLETGGENNTGATVIHHTGGTASGYFHVRRGSTYLVSDNAVPKWGSIYVDGGTVVVSGVSMTNVYSLYMGYSTADGEGLFVLTNGASLRAPFGFYIGYKSNSVATFVQYPGTVVSVGNQGGNKMRIGELDYAGGEGVGRYFIKGGTSGPLYAVEKNGVVSGYGLITSGSLSNAFTMNGTVIADDEGVDRSLEFQWGVYHGRHSSDPYVHSSTENTGTNGWYAVNRGRLDLTPFWIFSEASTPSTTYPPLYGKRDTYNWGEEILDDEIDLVNSARIAFDNLGPTIGWLTGSLLSADRDEVPSGLRNPVGIWHFETTDITYDSATLTFRYDAGAVDNSDDPVDALSVWQYRDGRWKDIGAVAGVDTETKTVTTSIGAVTDINTYFALAFRPPPGTILTFR